MRESLIKQLMDEFDRTVDQIEALQQLILKCIEEVERSR